MLTYAVVGNSAVGKSAFIRNAFNLRRSVPLLSSSRVLLSGVSYRLQLIETPRDSVTLEHGRILWPPIHELGKRPEIDGVFCLYDVSDIDSLEGLPQILAALDAAGLPTCLVSCKVDIPLCDHEVSEAQRDKLKSRFPRVLVEEASYDHSDSAKHCILKILRETLASRREDLQLQTRTKLMSDTLLNQLIETSLADSSVSSSSRHNQATAQSPPRSREKLSMAPPPPVIESDDNEESDQSSPDEADARPKPLKTPLRVNTNVIPPKHRVEQPHTPVSTTEVSGSRLMSPTKREAAAVPATPDSYRGALTTRNGSIDTNENHIYRTFLNMDDESVCEDNSRDDELAENLQDLTLEHVSTTDGLTFGELVDKLLAMPTSKGDQKFVPSFLCLYRAFATPLRLLMEIIDRFVRTETSNLVAFTKAGQLLRYLSILGLWTTHYPGDFADAKVRDMANTFVVTIEKTKSYAPAARQIANNLQTYVPDEDEDWGFRDGTKTTRSRSNTTSRALSNKPTNREHGSKQRPIKDMNDDYDSNSDEYMPTPTSPRYSGTTSSASSLVRSSQISSQTSDNLHNLESARDHAKRLRTIPRNPVSKTQWHLFMSCSTEELAIEITRIDWTMYSAIRPRDLIRYVTTSSRQRAQTGRTDYIGLMTRHFNHFALFVSGMILLRDKPKHRAKMLEKFMDLAWKVRQLNNYHSLGAIVAALNSEEIVRLAQTQEMISAEQHKQFLRLKILMGHQKSHAAYRMAWDNSSSERIPFLPRIQEDLTKAASANATFVGGKINWKKYEVMGETIVSVQRSQEQPYSFPDRTAKGSEISKVIIETRVLEGDEVRSQH